MWAFHYKLVEFKFAPGHKPSYANLLASFACVSGSLKRNNHKNRISKWPYTFLLVGINRSNLGVPTQKQAPVNTV